MERFKLTRKGQFSVHSSIENQCKAPGHSEYQYKIQIQCGNKLDSNLFIIDHQEIHNKIVYNTHAQSCEIMCKQIVNNVHSLLINHGVIVHRIKVKLKPVPNGLAYMILVVDY